MTSHPAHTQAPALIWAAHLALLAVTLVPVLSVEMPPLIDFPNHLARWYILANLESEPALQASYRTVSDLTPYLLVDFIAARLVEPLGIYDAGRFFIAMNSALIYLGVLAIHRALFNELTIWPAFALPILYNHSFMWGFVNFNFATAMMLIFLAVWLHIQHWRMRARLGVLFGQCFLLYFAHILVLGLYGLILCAHAIYVATHRDRKDPLAIVRHIALTAAPFAAALVVFLIWFANDDGFGDKITNYGTVQEKMFALLSPTMVTEGFSDVAIFLAYLAGAMLVAIFRIVHLARAMALSLLAMTALCIAMPTQLLGVYAVDLRFPPILVMITIAATRSRVGDGLMRHAVPAAVVALVVARVLTIWGPYQTTDRQFSEFRSAIAALPSGARVFTSHDFVDGPLAMPVRSFWHWSSVSVIEAQAFDPLLFTGVTQIRPTEQMRYIDTPCGPNLQTFEVEFGLDPGFVQERSRQALNYCWHVYWADWPQKFDYLIRINPTDLPASFDPYIAERRRSSFFELIKIAK